LPAWGREVIGDRYALYPSGQAGYTAFALAALGVAVRLVGVVGDDPWGSWILEALQKAGVDCGGVEAISGARTGITVAAVRPDGERAFISDFGCLLDFDAELLRRQSDRLKGCGIVALCGLSALPRLPLEAVEELFGSLRGQGIATALDTGWDPAGWPAKRRAGIRSLLQKVSLFLPNLEEAKALSGCGEPRKAARRLHEMGAEMAVIKLGGQGSLALGEGTMERLAALPVQVRDAVGAGDVFNAGFLAAFREGRGVRDCLVFGSAAASLYISRERDRFPSRAETLAAARAYGAAPAAP
jgi:ribokinase